ncbi:MAG: YciI family protein [Planctomycetota bacterium]
MSKSKFMFVYRSDAETETIAPSPEQMQEMMAAWHAWFASLGDSLIEGGDALLPMGLQVQPDGTVTDGPFIEGKEMVGGYSIVQADTIEEAAEMAKGCPMLPMGGNVEVRPFACLE